MPAEGTSYDKIWKIFTTAWDESDLLRHDLPIALATLVYLRWADFQEAELEAIADFDDTDYEPGATPRWSIDTPRRRSGCHHDLPGIVGLS